MWDERITSKLKYLKQYECMDLDSKKKLLENLYKLANSNFDSYSKQIEIKAN